MISYFSDWHFELKVHDEHGAILLGVLRYAGVENLALLLVRILCSQTKMVMISTGHVFGAEIVFDSLEFKGHHFQVATLDATGDFKERRLLIICERSVELSMETLRNSLETLTESSSSIANTTPEPGSAEMSIREHKVDRGF